MTATILIEGGTVIDGIGDTPRSNESVLISDGTITAVGAHADALAHGRPDIERIAAQDKTVMPGLIDAHTHLSFGEPTGNDELFFHRTEAFSAMLSARNARKVLRAGVTSVLDADCLWNIGVELRDAIEANVVEGPRMAAGGNALMTMLGGTAGRLIADEGRTGYATVVHNLEGISQEVRRQVKYGVDWIKVMVTGLIPSVKGPEVKVWNKTEMQTVVDAAHDLSTPVVGHCRNSLSTKEAAELLAQSAEPTSPEPDHAEQQLDMVDVPGQEPDAHQVAEEFSTKPLEDWAFDYQNDELNLGGAEWSCFVAVLTVLYGAKEHYTAREVAIAISVSDEQLMDEYTTLDEETKVLLRKAVSTLKQVEGYNFTEFTEAFPMLDLHRQEAVIALLNALHNEPTLSPVTQKSVMVNAITRVNEVAA